MKRVTTYGLEAATDHTFSYLAKYLVVGVLPICWLTCRWWFWPEAAVLFVALVGLHVVYLAVLFPGALLINSVAMRVARRRTWDLQPWRAWVAVILVVALEWGYFLSSDLERDSPEILTQALGPVVSPLIHFAGVLVLASTAAQIVAWAVPPSSSR